MLLIGGASGPGRVPMPVAITPDALRAGDLRREAARCRDARTRRGGGSPWRWFWTDTHARRRPAMPALARLLTRAHPETERPPAGGAGSADPAGLGAARQRAGGLA